MEDPPTTPTPPPPPTPPTPPTPPPPGGTVPCLTPDGNVPAGAALRSSNCTSTAQCAGGCVCNRFGNHSGPYCMSREMSCCNLSRDHPPRFTCDYPSPTAAARRLPQHLMIGDSITDGQYPFVAAALRNGSRGGAGGSPAAIDSHLIPINGGSTDEGVACAAVWAQDLERWAAITYNFGAWNVGSADCSLARNGTTGRYQDAALQEYVDQLANVTRVLLRTAAGKAGRLGFVLTTPSPQVPECCDNATAAATTGAARGPLGTHTCSKRTAVFNAAARALLQPLGVKIVDLWSWVAAKCAVPYGYDCPIQTMERGEPCQVHFDTPTGWQYVAEGYAAGVRSLFS
eukprot:g3399.t1